jgi:hypothetical protein
MLKNKIKTYITLFFFIFSLLGCEQYIGYNYEADEVNNTVRIYGQVVNTFTGEAVDSALVQIGVQKTLTDEYGNYTIHYIMGVDDQRDKPVQVIVSSKNYATHSSQFIVYNESKNYNIPLVYVAPIIKETTLGYEDGNNALTCEVLVLDYQGTNDIRLVKGTFFYSKQHEPSYKQIDIEFGYFQFVSNISAIYRCKVPIILWDGWSIPPHDRLFYIYAEDY